MCDEHADFRLPDEGLRVRVSAEDETTLSYMKMGVAGHRERYLGTTECIRWQGDGCASE